VGLILAFIAVPLIVFAGAATGVFIVSGGRLHPPPQPPASTTSSVPAPPASVTPTASASAPHPHASASAAASASASPDTDTRPPFNLPDAKAAIAASLKGIAACKKPGGRIGPGLVKVTFSPDDGTVTGTAIQWPFSDTSPEGKCVADLVKTARIKPYKPQKWGAASILYQFTIPH
jgi:hypothetical protein